MSQRSDEVDATPENATRLPFLSVTPLPHHGKLYLGISSMVIHSGALPLNSRGQRKQWLNLQLWREYWKTLAQKHKGKWGQRRVCCFSPR